MLNFQVCYFSAITDVVMAFICFSPIPAGSIRIHHECEDGIEKCVPRITDWHREACRVMTNGDHEVRIFLFHPHTNIGFFLAHH